MTSIVVIQVGVTRGVKLKIDVSDNGKKLVLPLILVNGYVVINA